MCESDTNTLHQLNAPTDSFNIKDPQTTSTKIHSFPDQTTSKPYQYVEEDQHPSIPVKISWSEIPQTLPPPPPPPSLGSIPSITSNQFTASTNSSFGSPSYSLSIAADIDEVTGSDIDKSEVAITLGAWNGSLCSNYDVPCTESLYHSKSDNHKDGDIKIPDAMTIIDANESEEDEEPENAKTNLYHISPIQANDNKNVNKAKPLKDEVIERTADETSHDNDRQKDGDYAIAKVCGYERGRFKPTLGSVNEKRVMLNIRENIHKKLNANAVVFKPGRLFTETEVIQLIHQHMMKKKKVMEEICKKNKIPFSDSCTKNRKKPKKKKPNKAKVGYNNFLPQSTRDIFAIPQEFTAEILPQQVIEDMHIDKKGFYEFMIQMLGVMKIKPNDVDTEKILDFGLNNIYFRAKRQDPKNTKLAKYQKFKPWIIDEYVTSDDVKQDEIVRPPQLLDRAEMRHVQSLMADKQTLMKIIADTKWNKIPIYGMETEDKNRRWALSLTKEEFNNDCKQFMESMDMTNIQLVPIVMFDHRDRYFVEYVWIVRIGRKQRVDIGISFRLSKSKDSVHIVGVYINKNQILKQHRIISPLVNSDILDNFSSFIDYFHIGNPDDDKNRAKDAINRCEKMRDALIEIQNEFP